ncbi:MAG: hypothetical protein O6949_01740 [Chloroflexi bacterium]|nr:hypothetical protein [Chloroflexota bacterium]
MAYHHRNRTGRQIPETCLPIAAARENVPPIGTEDSSENLAGMPQGGRLRFSRLRVPQSSGAVGAGSDEDTAAGTEFAVIHQMLVPDGPEQQLARLSIPDAGRLIERGADDAASIGAECSMRHPGDGGMARPCGHRRSGDGIPNAELNMTNRQQPTTVGAELYYFYPTWKSDVELQRG